MRALSLVFLASTCSAFQGLHLHMNEAELNHYFGGAEVTPDYEVVEFDAASMRDKRGGASKDGSLRHSFAAFGQRFDLNLKKNNGLVGPLTTVVKRSHGNISPLLPKGGLDCHYQHQDDSTLAAISLCEEKEVRGMIYTKDHVLEVHPLTDTLLGKVAQGRENKNVTTNSFHTKTFSLVTKRSQEDVEDRFKRLFNFDRQVAKNTVNKRSNKMVSRQKYLELGIFVDYFANDALDDFFGSNEKAKTDYVIGFVNAIHGLYHLPSLHEMKIDLYVVRLEFIDYPFEFTKSRGDRDIMYKDFCAYQHKINLEGDDNDGHWDLAVALTGLDLYDNKQVKESHRLATMGLSYVGGICVSQYSCVISEFGSKGPNRKLYPSTGPACAFVAGHELGHNLGLSHDNGAKYSRCDKGTYLMSPSRGTRDKTNWSACSAEKLQEHLSSVNCLDDKPNNIRPEYELPKEPEGIVMDATRQCVMFLLDNGAYAENLDTDDICSSIKCNCATRDGYALAGPALEGTKCGPNKYCSSGECTSSPSFEVPKQESVVEWSEWTSGNCYSACLEGGKGYIHKRRVCEETKPSGHKVLSGGCQGERTMYELCDDSDRCGRRPRESWEEYVADKCYGFSQLVDIIHPRGRITRAPHSKKDPRAACSIYCQFKDRDAYFTPKIQLNEYSEHDVYFPDGYNCHNEVVNGKKVKFYCLARECLPENSKSYRSGAEEYTLSNIPEEIPKSLMDFFTLDADSKPVEGGSPYVPEHQDSFEVDDTLPIP